MTTNLPYRCEKASAELASREKSEVVKVSVRIVRAGPFFPGALQAHGGLIAILPKGSGITDVIRTGR